MNNYSLGSWPPLEGAGKRNRTESGTGLPNYEDRFSCESSPYPITEIIISVFILVISIFGLMGNGTVIWILGFCLKKTPFTTFILHLAVADLGTLIGLSSVSVINLLCSSSYKSSISLFIKLSKYFFVFMYNAGQYLLTAISIDRCVCVVFPVWYRCHRPPHLSFIACALIWIISPLVGAAELFTDNSVTIYLVLIVAMFCLFLMTISTLILFIKVYFRAQQRKQGRALTAILLALLFFLFLALPFTFILLILFLKQPSYDKTVSVAICVGFLCSCLNSSFNPLIYFLIGREKRKEREKRIMLHKRTTSARSRESMKVILQRLFEEEQKCREEQDIPVQTQM